MSSEFRFALNHITCLGRDIDGLATLAADLGMTDVEIRNDIAGVPLGDGTAAAVIAPILAGKGLKVLTVNALQRFNEWNDDRADEAERLAAETAAAGAEALVLCPVNEAGWTPNPEMRSERLREALAALLPILRRHGLKGYVEVLGFSISSLRYKGDAVAAIDAVDGGNTLLLVHDTFHHAISSDPDMFPDRTGLVHISGVEPEGGVDKDTMLDGDRVLIGVSDALDNTGQIAALLRGGYTGAFSFECFAASVHHDVDIAQSLRFSMEFIRDRVRALTL
ncbi:MAG: TIM barrel protein [Sphingobium sp.]|nr:TIM barrel protein [Sphingobium sp.]MCP5400047.1 TIM barrel protein [Sphingomonas sp.]